MSMDLRYRLAITLPLMKDTALYAENLSGQARPLTAAYNKCFRLRRIVTSGDAMLEPLVGCGARLPSEELHASMQFPARARNIPDRPAVAEHVLAL